MFLQQRPNSSIVLPSCQLSGSALARNIFCQSGHNEQIRMRARAQISVIFKVGCDAVV